MNIILLGPPGCGKGTQGARLAQHRNLPRIATGDLLREAVQAGTPLGREAKDYMDRGLLVPDDVILGLIDEVLARPEAAAGVIMDGFPRTVVQAESVDRRLADRGMTIDRVLAFSVPDDELVRRILGRAVEEGRSDDTPEAVRRRLEVYREQTAPVVDYYRDRDLVSDIEGVGTIDEIAGRIDEALGT